MNLQVAVADIADCQKELTIEIGADDVKTEYGKAYEAYARYAKVPGFRPGNVPKSIVKQRFAKEINGEVIQQILPHALGHAIEDHKLKVIGSPEVNTDEIKVKEGEALKFTARVTVIPDFELKDYKGLKLTKRVAIVTDEKIAQVMQELREGAAQLVPVEDRPSQLGDFVSINIVGKYVDAPEQEDLKTEDLTIELGGQGVQEEFTTNLTGVKEGDVKEFTVKYPEDFTSEGLAGKTLNFTATVSAVKIKELPELDDNFAQEMAEEYSEEYKTIDEMHAKVRENLIANAGVEAENDLRDEMLESLAKDYDFPLPEPLVERQANSRLQEFVQRLFRSGVPPQAARQINWEERQAEERKRAQNDVRLALLLGAVADAEKINVTREDLDSEIERIAASVGQSVDEIEARLTKEGSLSSIENRLRSDKVVNFLVSQAEITTEEYEEKEAAEENTAVVEEKALADEAGANAE